MAIYNMPFFYRLSIGNTLSIKQLHQAIQKVIIKHQSLRTSFYIDTNQNNKLIQKILDVTNFDRIQSLYQTDEQLNEIFHDEKSNPKHFDLIKGQIFRCHIVYYKQISSNDFLNDKDILIFNFHHIIFDFPSINIFLDDLNQAYTNSQLTIQDNTNICYLDCKLKEMFQ
jgi:hypothetical protein